MSACEPIVTVKEQQMLTMISLHTYSAVNCQLFWCTTYSTRTVRHLSDLVHFVNIDSNRSRFPSATTRAATTLQTWTKLGDCAFSAAGPSLVWNSHPPSLRFTDSYTRNSADSSKHCSNRLTDC